MKNLIKEAWYQDDKFWKFCEEFIIWQFWQSALMGKNLVWLKRTSRQTFRTLCKNEKNKSIIL